MCLQGLGPKRGGWWSHHTAAGKPLRNTCRCGFVLFSFVFCEGLAVVNLKSC